jgi:hypothetical protein
MDKIIERAEKLFDEESVGTLKTMQVCIVLANKI